MLMAGIQLGERMKIPEGKVSKGLQVESASAPKKGDLSSLGDVVETEP